MLILARKKGEAVIINDNIAIEVVQIVRDKVRLGISAPKEVTVHRQEVWLEIQRKKDEEKNHAFYHSETNPT